ncbi:MAG: hypothetical protein WCP74_13365 [Sphingobacteriia bacterium]|jgi:hypothetical protein
MGNNKFNQDSSINTKSIIAGMVLLFIALQLGFHPTYIQYFPAFEKFTWLHHVHGALMASWIILLVVQPIFILKGKLKSHRFLGKLSYIIAPLMILSMFLVLRFTFHKHVLDVAEKVELSNQAPIIMQLIGFTILYTLAIFYRKQTYYHMRFMIGTAVLMMIPIVGRIFFEYFGATVWYDLYLTVGLSIILLMNDIRNKQNWKPYAIVTGVLMSILFVYLIRNTDAWYFVGRFWANNFY